MQTSPAAPVLIACIVATLCSTGGFAVAAMMPNIVDPAATSTIQPAVRNRSIGVEFDSTIREVAIIGDSILADIEAEGVYPNRTVELVDNAMRARSNTAHVVVRNFAAPGVATRFPAGPGFGTLDSHIRAIFPEQARLPDVVIIAVSSIDLNAHPDVPVAELGPSIISELDRVARALADRGVRTVFVPTFGANSELFNQLKNALQPTFRDYMLNARIEQLNQLLIASELPILFDRFRQLDDDGDGSADRRFFDGRNGPGDVGDGIHPNELGQRLYAANLIDALAAAFEHS